ncbi:MAG: rhamnulokinase family protein [Aggregatilineales bacterium]
MGTKVVAIDFGAASGRVVEVTFDGERISREVTHRFDNTPVRMNGTLHWDVLRLWHEVVEGLSGVKDAASIGVDTWGVDFALLDKQGNLLSNPVHYRDSRNDGMMEWVFERMPRRDIFEQTGIQFMQINALYQMASLVRDGSPLLDIAETALTMSDFFSYLLTGTKVCEFSQASTWQLVNPHTRDWAFPVMEAVGIPTRIMPPLVEPGERIGTYQGTPVFIPAGHDTGSAVVAVPTTTKNYAYLSSGTWSLLGLEVDEPVVNDASYEANLTNEGGYNHTTRLLKNIMGLWLVQQARETWRRQGSDYSFDDLVKMAESADFFKAFVDPDHVDFLPPGDMGARVCAFCERTGQAVPGSHAEITAAIYASLAFKYRYVLEKLIDVSGQQVDRLHIIGGGAQNALLCQMTADAIGREVLAGPIEATALGNAVVQMISLGEIGDLAQAREILSRSVGMVSYTPQNTAEWDAHYARFVEIVGT